MQERANKATVAVGGGRAQRAETRRQEEGTVPVLLVVPLSVQSEGRFVHGDQIHEKCITPQQDPSREGDPLDLGCVVQGQSLRRLVVGVPDLLDAPVKVSHHMVFNSYIYRKLS